MGKSIGIQKVKACLPQKIFLQKNKTIIFILESVLMGLAKTQTRIKNMEKDWSNKTVPNELLFSGNI